MIQTNVYDGQGELIHSLYWNDDNSAKAFMFDAMVNYNYDFEFPYDCILEGVETRNGERFEVYGVYPHGALLKMLHNGF